MGMEQVWARNWHNSSHTPARDVQRSDSTECMQTSIWIRLTRPVAHRNGPRGPGGYREYIDSPALVQLPIIPPSFPLHLASNLPIIRSSAILSRERVLARNGGGR